MPKVYSALLRRHVEISEEESARRAAAREPKPEAPPPSYELIVLERDTEGGIKRMLFRPVEEKAGAKGKAA